MGTEPEKAAAAVTVVYRASHRHDVFVSLTIEERAAAGKHGSTMYLSSQARGLHDKRPGVRNGVTGERVQRLGSIAERAVAKALGIEWTAWSDTFKAADLHFNIEVRLIGVDHYGLRVYDRDHDSRRVVGIVIERGSEHLPYRIPGWINAVHAKRREWRIDPHDLGQPVYAVPQDRLHPLALLRLFIQEEARP